MDQWRSLLRNRDVMRLLIASAISRMALGAQFVVLSWSSLVEKGGSSLTVGQLMACLLLPSVLFAPFFGVLADRFNRRRLLVVLQFFRAGMMFILATAVAAGNDQSFLLFVVAFIVATADAAQKPAAAGLIKEISSASSLLGANAAVSVVEQSGMLIGGGLAGLLLAYTSLAASAVAMALCLTISAVILSTIVTTSQTTTSSEDELTQGRFGKFIREVRLGCLYLWSRPAVCAAYGLLALLGTMLSTINVLLAPFCQNILESGAGAVGIIDAGFAAGALMGGALVAKFAGRCGERVTLAAGLVLTAISLMAFAFVPNVALGLCVYLVLGCIFQVWVVLLTAAQRQTAAEYQGRVFSTFQMASGIAGAATSLIIGYLGTIVGERSLYLAQAGVMIVAAILSLSIPQQFFQEETMEVAVTLTPT